MLWRSGCNDTPSISLALEADRSNRSTDTNHQEELPEIMLRTEAGEHARLVWSVCLGNFSVSQPN